MDFVSLVPIGAFFLGMIAISVYRYSTRNGISVDMAGVLNAVRTIVSKLDDLDIENDEKKKYAIDYVHNIVSALGYEVDKKTIDDMIEHAVFILHESNKYLDFYDKGDNSNG